MAIRKKKDPRHYVDNKKLFEEMKKFKELCYEAEESGEERPPVSHYIGECFLKIANGLSFRPNFVNYTCITLTPKNQIILLLILLK